MTDGVGDVRPDCLLSTNSPQLSVTTYVIILNPLHATEVLSLHVNDIICVTFSENGQIQKQNLKNYHTTNPVLMRIV